MSAANVQAKILELQSRLVEAQAKLAETQTTVEANPERINELNPNADEAILAYLDAGEEAAQIVNTVLGGVQSFLADIFDQPDPEQ